MMRAPLSSVNGPVAAIWPLSRRPSRYWRWTGRTAATLALSCEYSMMAANFMGNVSGRSGGGLVDGNQLVLHDALGREERAGQPGVRAEQHDRKAEVAQQRVVEERQAGDIARQQAFRRPRVHGPRRPDG